MCRKCLAGWSQESLLTAYFSRTLKFQSIFKWKSRVCEIKKRLKNHGIALIWFIIQLTLQRNRRKPSGRYQNIVTNFKYEKLLIAILGMTIIMIGCTKESINDPNIPNTDQKSTRSEVLPDTNLRLAFPDIETFQSEIKNIDYDGRSNSLNKLASKYLRDDIASRKYVGLLSK